MKRKMEFTINEEIAVGLRTGKLGISFVTEEEEKAIRQCGNKVDDDFVFDLVLNIETPRLALFIAERLKEMATSEKYVTSNWRSYE